MTKYPIIVGLFYSHTPAYALTAGAGIPVSIKPNSRLIHLAVPPALRARLD